MKFQEGHAGIHPAVGGGGHRNFPAIAQPGIKLTLPEAKYTDGAVAPKQSIVPELEPGSGRNYGGCKQKPGFSAGSCYQHKGQ